MASAPADYLSCTLHFYNRVGQFTPSTYVVHLASLRYELFVNCLWEWNADLEEGNAHNCVKCRILSHSLCRSVAPSLAPQMIPKAPGRLASHDGGEADAGHAQGWTQDRRRTRDPQCKSRDLLQNKGSRHIAFLAGQLAEFDTG